MRCEPCEGTGRRGAHGTCRACAGFGSIPTLFDAPRAGDARRSDPRTAKIAAGSNLTERQTQKKLILERMLAGPLSSHEAAEFTGGQFGRASKRLGELRDASLVEECGTVPQAVGQGGTPRTLYRLTDAGRRTISVLIGAA